MACFGYCFLGFIFIGIMAAFAFTSKNTKEMKDFKEALKQDDLNDQTFNREEEYNKIIKERALIYFQGMIIGLVLGIIFLTLLKGNTSIPLSQKICIFLVVALGINFLHYMAVPKSKYILDLNLSHESTKAWLKVYKSMKGRQFLGALVGIIGYIVFSYGYSC
tara:strand:- start:13517 stop:14005 length:489 start_codon:yes stop_codon:yes gene_type:complete